VDDDPTVLMITSAMLEELGYEVTTRNEALGTSAIIMREQPDIVLIDIEMPALSGDRLVQLLRTSDALKNTSFILYSATRAADLKRLVGETGALGAIAKTGDYHEFIDEFQRLARNRRRVGT
jgi:CheY-like chemotaxis protein